MSDYSSLVASGVTIGLVVFWAAFFLWAFTYYPERFLGASATGSLGSRLRAIPPLELLRMGVGLVWVANLLFIVDPANAFFATFSSAARSYASSTFGGSGLATLAANEPTLFGFAVAITTAYLAAALLLGLTTRLSCWVGIAFSAILLLTQVGSTFVMPGGTDVGPHPLYLLIYVVLLAGGAGRTWSLDHWVWSTRFGHFPRLGRWPGAPSE